MHTLVIFVTIIVTSVSSFAGKIPDLRKQSEELTRVIQNSRLRSSRLISISSQLSYFQSRKCGGFGLGGILGLKYCWNTIEQIRATIEQIQSQRPYVKERILALPDEFSGVRAELLKNLEEEQQWAEKVQAALDQEKFKVSKWLATSIEDSVQTEIRDLEHKSELQHFCEAAKAKIEIMKDTTAYYESIDIDFPTFDRLHFKVRHLLKRAQQLSKVCFSEKEWSTYKQLLEKLSERTNKAAFLQFKSRACRSPRRKTFTHAECLRLIRNPETIMILQSLLSMHRETL